MKRSLCILLVEDDPALGPMTYHALEHLGHRSVLATTAPIAYGHLSRAHEFHLVLLDLQLGDQRSEPLILQLREEGFIIPTIVIFSAQPMFELQRVQRNIGARSFIQKPASIEEIDLAVDRAVA